VTGIHQNDNRNHSPERLPGAYFEDAYRLWSKLLSRLPRNLANANSSLYVFENDLDHELSYVKGLAERVLKKSTQTDFGAVAAAELTDLEKLTQRLDQLPIPDSQKLTYKDLIAATRILVEAIEAIPISEEGHLGFPKMAKREFEFLEQEYGFRLLGAGAIFVQYESSTARIELRFSGSIPEMTFRIAKLSTQDLNRWFYLDDLLYAAGCQSLLDYTRFDLGTREGVRCFLWELSAMVRKYGMPFLRGEAADFQLLAEKAAERDRRRSEQLDRLYKA
jgi:hypothetical protein